MNTLGNNTKTKATYQESTPLALGFPAASDLNLGQMVVLKASGEVDKISASTNKPFGIVTKGAETGEYATIITSFCAKISATAQVDTETSNEVSVHLYDVANKTDKYKPSAADDFVVGIALSDATAGNEIEIGILRVPYKKA